MVIGQIDLAAFADVISRLEKDLRRQVNYVVYSEIEWKSKVANREPFVLNVQVSPKIILMGGEDAL